jgi:hypothetical protein
VCKVTYRNSFLVNVVNSVKRHALGTSDFNRIILPANGSRVLNFMHSFVKNMTLSLASYVAHTSLSGEPDVPK